MGPVIPLLCKPSIAEPRSLTTSSNFPRAVFLRRPILSLLSVRIRVALPKTRNVPSIVSFIEGSMKNRGSVVKTIRISPISAIKSSEPSAVTADRKMSICCFAPAKPSWTGARLRAPVLVPRPVPDSVWSVDNSASCTSVERSDNSSTSGFFRRVASNSTNSPGRTSPRLDEVDT